MIRSQSHTADMEATDPLLAPNEAQAEAEALSRAIAEARADARGIPHEDMRVWLQKIADGELSAEPPVPRIL